MDSLPHHGPGRPSVPLEDRFWTKVIKRDGNTCWLWTGAINGRGYGTISQPITGKTILAHRVSYVFTYGPIADDICVLHTCDIRNCVCPSHLFLGDRGDNARDAIAKGRFHIPDTGTGEKNANAKLTTVQVRSIKQMIHDGRSNKEIGQIYGVSSATINEIRLGRNWKHVSRECRDSRENT